VKVLKVKGLYFSAGHRIPGHDYCYRPHGHTYFVEMTYVPKDDTLDELGMVIDFGDLKGGLKEYLKDNWDHVTIIQNAPEEIDAWVQLFDKLKIPLKYLKPLQYTTAEHMQELMEKELAKMFPEAERIIVELFEGPMQGIGTI